MAIIPIFHVVAAEKLVATGQTIQEGQVVTLNADGEVVLTTANLTTAYGLAGDTKSNSGSSMPGVYAGWQNRASDYFDETKASGKMTVYHSGGEFATDQFAANVASDGDIMDPLYAVDGLLDTDDSYTTQLVVAYLTKLPDAYISGVPGVDINGDQALAGQYDPLNESADHNQYIEVKLAI